MMEKKRRREENCKELGEKGKFDLKFFSRKEIDAGKGG